MARTSYTFTSESVSEGHPDKVCDRISDAVLDALIAVEPEARVAAETFATTNQVVIGGEIGLSDPAKLAGMMGDIDQIARDCIRDIGYEQDKFHWKYCNVMNLLHEQSAHIAQGVDASSDKDEGAGDQGIMFGYATTETPELMPAPIHYAHAILRRLAEVRKDGTEPTLGPDAKSQLSVRYENGVPVGVSSIVLSTQHLDETMTSADVRAVVEPYIREVLPEGWIDTGTEWHVNPTGKFVIGGPDGDAGLTGRKIIVDTYGGAAPHGGGAFSGKDPTKVDRSAAYVSRYLAKNVVAAGMASRCTVQLSYAIGVAKPLSIYVDTHGTGEVDAAAIETAIPQVIDLTPRGIRTHLDLNKPIYQRTAAYGHFGRAPEADGGFSWERTDLGKHLKDSQKGYLEEDLSTLSPGAVDWDENPTRDDLDLKALFGGRDVWLEVGFGGGEHVIHQAAENPDVGIIGCEPYINGVAMLLGKVRKASVDNLRIYPGDVRDMFDVLPEQSISKAFLLYPDPWPKARHHRRRFVTPEHLEPLARVLKPGAEFRVATDIKDYVRQTLEEVPKAGFEWQAERAEDWRTPWNDWISTRYEQKALREGRTPHYLTFRKT
ncbi:S-adenosylmethionine synthase [Nymphon striatum]|nr:S-adenosylmethionine synthase [Nymphon striatum]